MILVEAIQDDDAVQVHYMTPEDVINKNKHVEVFHDDEDMSDVPLIPPSQQNDVIDAPCGAISTPYDAVDIAKQDPCKVAITKFKDIYYLDHNDLKQFMQARQMEDYDNAVYCIIRAHKDDPEICPDKLRVIMGASDLQNCTEEEKSRLENANINVEVYENR